MVVVFVIDSSRDECESFTGHRLVLTLSHFLCFVKIIVFQTFNFVSLTGRTSSLSRTFTSIARSEPEE